MNSILYETKNGKVFKCGHCDKIHIEYKNLNFNFTEEQFNEFSDYLFTIDGWEWEAKNMDGPFIRKIIIPIGSYNFRILLNNQELIELKFLVMKGRKSNKERVNIVAFDLEFVSYLN
jgi:hypothetical protein